MSLSSLQLDAFLAVARIQSFSKAALQLGLTQSALSQRVKNLEEFLSCTLFIREVSQVLLTPQGQRLLQYCQQRESLESESLHDLHVSTTQAVSGTIRIAGYSSVVRSMLMPALAPLIRSHPAVLCEFLSRELSELPELLLRGATDYIVLDYEWEKPGITRISLGREKYVVIESTRYTGRETTFLDHDAADTATQRYFTRVKSNFAYQRAFMDDVYGVLEGVNLGLGRAVISEHLVKGMKGIKRIKSFGTQEVPIVLHFYTQAYYSKLHAKVLDQLSSPQA